jgi:hypothetical protein
MRRWLDHKGVSVPDMLVGFGIAAEMGYAAVAAAQWAWAAHWLYDPHDGLWCGNVITGPYLFICDFITPLAALLAAWLAVRCIKIGRWAGLSGFALMLFVATTAALVYEAWFLKDYLGFNLIRCVQWLPIRRF